MAEQNKSVMPLVDNPIVGGKGANRTKRVGFKLGSRVQRQADAEDVRERLNEILNGPAYLAVIDLKEYREELKRVSDGTEGQLAEQAAPEEVKS